MRWLAGLALLTLVASCGGAAPGMAPATATLGPTPSVTPRPPSPLRSGGLGLTLAEWEQSHGALEGQEETVNVYAAGAFRVYAGEGRVTQIERHWRPDEAPTENGARQVSEALMPLDADLARSYTVDGRFRNGAPGEFIVLYLPGSSGRIASIMIGLGNSP